ncbi:unnamed protein product, partial [Ectocarpus fasciculatus]
LEDVQLRACRHVVCGCSGCARFAHNQPLGRTAFRVARHVVVPVWCIIFWRLWCRPSLATSSFGPTFLSDERVSSCCNGCYCCCCLARGRALKGGKGCGWNTALPLFLA